MISKTFIKAIRASCTHNQNEISKYAKSGWRAVSSFELGVALRLGLMLFAGRSPPLVVGMGRCAAESVPWWLELLGGQLEASCSLLASGSSGNNLLASDQLPQGELDTDTGLGSVDLVVGNDVLEDGLAGGALLVPERLDGGNNHVGIGRVGGRLGDLLNLGGLGFGHFDGCDLAGLANLAK